MKKRKIRVKKHTRKQRKTGKIGIVRSHSRMINKKKLKQPIAKERSISELRSCFKCKSLLNFKEFRQANPDESFRELERLWKNPRIELICCGCYKKETWKEELEKLKEDLFKEEQEVIKLLLSKLNLTEENVDDIAIDQRRLPRLEEDIEEPRAIFIWTKKDNFLENFKILKGKKDIENAALFEFYEKHFLKPLEIPNWEKYINQEKLISFLRQKREELHDDPEYSYITKHLVEPLIQENPFKALSKLDSINIYQIYDYPFDRDKLKKFAFDKRKELLSMDNKEILLPGDYFAYKISSRKYYSSWA